MSAVAPVISVRALLLLGMASALAATDGLGESANDSWTGRDKVEHATAGFLIGAGTDWAIGEFAPPVPKWERIPLAFGTALTAGILKEVYDHQHPSLHSASQKDAAVTALGGALGTFVVELHWSF